METVAYMITITAASCVGWFALLAVHSMRTAKRRRKDTHAFYIDRLRSC